MNEYGFQCFDASGALLWDETAIFSRVLGYSDIDWFAAPVSSSSAYEVIWTRTVTGLDFSEGTPFCALKPLPLTSSVLNSWYNQFPPDVIFSETSIVMKYYNYHAVFPDDIATALYLGGVRVTYGIYTA